MSGGPTLVKMSGAGNDFILLDGEQYRSVEAGFGEVTAIDISRYTMQTMGRWRENALQYKASDASQKEYAQRFQRGCEILEGFFRKGLFGYGLVRAKK